MHGTEELSELWELFGEISEEVAHYLNKLADLIERNPECWTWFTVWLGLIWVCLRWTKIVADKNDRRIYEAAEARLGILIRQRQDALLACQGAGEELDELLILDETTSQTDGVATIHPS